MHNTPCLKLFDESQRLSDVHFRNLGKWARSRFHADLCEEAYISALAYQKSLDDVIECLTSVETLSTTARRHLDDAVDYRKLLRRDIDNLTAHSSSTKQHYAT